MSLTMWYLGAGTALTICAWRVRPADAPVVRWWEYVLFVPIWPAGMAYAAPRLWAIVAVDVRNAIGWWFLQRGMALLHPHDPEKLEVALAFSDIATRSLERYRAKKAAAR